MHYTAYLKLWLRHMLQQRTIHSLTQLCDTMSNWTTGQCAVPYVYIFLLATITHKAMGTEGYSRAQQSCISRSCHGSQSLQGTVLDGHALELKRSTKRLTKKPGVKTAESSEAKSSKLIIRNVPFQVRPSSLPSIPPKAHEFDLESCRGISFSVFPFFCHDFSTP